MTQIVWIARHANRLDFVNPEWFNTAERPYDPPISDDGAVQAEQLAARLRRESNITQIFASPFLRTVQTANKVAAALDLPINLEIGMSEWLNPAWMTVAPERLSFAALTELFPRINNSYQSRVAAEYPETAEVALERSGKTAKILAEEFSSEDILLVGHGASVLGATIGLVGGTQAETEVNAALCCLVKLVCQDREWVMELNGDTSHLSQTEEVIRFH